jgi:5-methyltetrahydrofolate--homocysteine methyltransferase
MIYKEDIEIAKERLDAFWEGEIIDRCCIAITAPKNNTYDIIQARSLEEKWLDYDFRYNHFLKSCNETHFLGEAFPSFWNNLGPGVMAACIGGNFKLGDDTVWFDTNPIIKDWNSIPELKIYEDSEMWQLLYNLTLKFAQSSNGQYITGISDIGGNFDILAALRGTENLLYDLYDEPEAVKETLGKIENIWCVFYNKLFEMISKYQTGVTTWMPMWCREKYYPLQCDFSAMLSPSLFEEFVKPALKKEAQFLDKSIFHLDGPSATCHLDHLLEIDEITGIQWSPGSGQPGVFSEKWFPMYKKIQQKGKNLVLMSDEFFDIENVLQNISSKGLFISTSCKSKEDAIYLLDKAKKYSH